MGVTGLWKLIEQSGKPVPLETLENKVLAVDISIWLHQVVKGFQDNRGATLPNAHLLGLFHRLCKLLYYKIRPVFVFDGGVPELKRETIAKRSKNKLKYHSEADKLQQLLLDSLAKEKVVQQALGASSSAFLASPAKSSSALPSDAKDDIFKLPPIKDPDFESSMDQSASFTDISGSDSSFDEKSTRNYALNIQDVDVKSSYFQGLPADIRHDILTDLKETRKQSSWGRLHELPVESNNFSSFQMKRLLKRRQVQIELEEAEKEIGGKSLSLVELESLLSEKGIVDPEIAKERVMSNEHVRFLHVRDLRKAIDKEAKSNVKPEPIVSKAEEPIKNEEEAILLDRSIDNLLATEEDMELQRAIQLSLETNPNDLPADEVQTIEHIHMTRNQKKAFGAAATCLARDYMLEYGGMNDDDINQLIQPSGNELSFVDNSEFKYNDSFILNGKVNECTQTTTVETSLTKPTNEATIIEIADDSDDEGVSSDIDSDFVDVPDPDDVAGVSSFYVNQVLPVQMNKPPEVDLTKDFRLNDLNRKKIEVVVQPNDILEEKDDIFADVFNSNTPVDNNQSAISIQTKTKIKSNVVPKPVISKTNPDKMKNILNDLDAEMAEITQINLNSILNIGLQGTEADDIITVTEDLVAVDSLAVITEINSNSILNDDKEKSSVELKLDDQVNPSAVHSEISNEPNLDIKTGGNTENSKILSQITLTPVKSIIISDEETPPKVVQPFFVKRTPSSKKKVSTNDAKSSQSPSKVAKNLFESGPVLDEQQAINMAANLLKEAKSKDELESIASQLRTDRSEMELERNKRDRLGGSITERMTQECMELLRLFGIPYIVAPMEAEAQCAFLNQIELTDGTITDDSDIWLFGGKTVYKNFFDQNKHVLEYKVGNIERLFHVDRHKMIQMSILVGSDYTTGIHGIGTVTALEVLATFSATPEKEGETNEIMSLLSSLRKFRDWWQNKSNTQRTQALRSKLKNITFTESFPSSRVVQAYLYPQVDQSKEKFTWGRPDEESIREFAKNTFGWTRKKTDDILMPVVRRLNEKISQQSIRNYFKIDSISTHRELMLSKRVKNALEKMSNPIEDSPSSATTASVATTSGTVKQMRKAPAKKRAKKEGLATPAAAADDIEIVDSTNAPKTRKRKAKSTVAEADNQTATSNESETIVASKYFPTIGAAKIPQIPDTNPPIPQREKDKEMLEQNKLKAIQMFKNKKK